MLKQMVKGEAESANSSFTILLHEHVLTFDGWWRLNELAESLDGAHAMNCDLSCVVHVGDQNFLVHPDDQSFFSDVVRELHPGKDIHWKLRLLTGDSHLVELESNGSVRPTNTPDDIVDTHQSRAETELCRNCSLLLESETEALIGSWIYTPSNGEFRWSEGMYKMFAIPRHREVDPTIYVTATIAEDQPAARRIATSIIGATGSFEETIHIRRNGEVRTLRVKGASVGDGGRRRMIGVDLDISALAKSTLEAKEQTELLLESQSIGKIGSYDLDVVSGRLTWSAEMYRIMGIPEGTEVTLANVIQQYHPDDAARLSALIEQAIATGEGFETEVALRRKGEADFRYIQIVSRVLKDPFGRVIHLRGIGQDITERKQASQEILRMQEALAAKVADKYRQLFESIDEGFAIAEVMLDEDGTPVDCRFLEANPAFERQTGFAKCAGKTIRALAPDQERHWISMYGRVVQTQSAVRYVEQASQIGRWYDVYAFPTDQPGTNRVAILLHDVTDRKLSEEELKRLYGELKELDHAKTKFFNNISHEFRTPLTLMLGPLEEVMRRDAMDLSRKGLEQLTLVQRNAQRLEKMVNTLLDFSRIEAGRMEASFQATDLRKFTLELASNFRGLFEQAGLSFVVAADELDEPVFINRSMYEKIVLNLLSNAFKFTLNGSISVILRNRDRQVELHVIDTGIGIAQADQRKIFQRFTRVEVTKARTAEGSGIGLALVKELVGIHGGHIRLKSEHGKGSEFIVTLEKGKSHLPSTRIFDGRTSLAPSVAGAHLQEATAWAQDAIAAVPDPKGWRHGYTVLVADDNSDMRSYLQSILEPQYRVIKASNGRHALELLRQETVNLVLADVMMPEVDGYELVNSMLRDEALRKIPAILLTARTGDEERAAGFHHGAEDYMVKPFSARELLARVDARIQLAAARAEAETSLVQANQSLEKKVQQYTAELREYNTQLKNRNERLQILNDELTGLTFAASHDMREPLRKLRFFTQRILKEEQGNLTDKGQHYFNRILSFVQTMSDLVSDVALYSHYERNNGQVTSIDLTSLLENLREFIRPVLEQKRATLDFQVAPGLTGDYEQVKQVIYNLISNSMKFCKKDAPLSIGVVGKTIAGEFIDDPRAERGQRYYELQVHDNGIGFDQQYQHQIFQIFRKLHGPAAHPGTGIGLTIVRKIMDNHNGFVVARSSLGLGASFCCYFPVSETTAGRDPRDKPTYPENKGS